MTTSPSPATDLRPRPRPRIVLIAAVARNGAIGRDNGLLWHEPADQRRFRELTLGAPALMGRKTWDSLPDRFRPLPGRRNLVLTRQADWQAAGAESVDSLAAALALVGDDDTPRLCVIGGAEVYRLALPHANELRLTEIDADLDGDTFFPAWDRSAFEPVAIDARVDARGTPYRFVDYRRRAMSATDSVAPTAAPVDPPAAPPTP